MTNARRIVCAVSLAVACAPAVARAQSSDEGRERFQAGIDRFNEGDLEGALAQFQRAHELTRSPVVLYNVGLVQAKLGRPVEASDALRKVIVSPGPLSAEKLERARQTEREQATRIGELSVECNVAGAAIEIDGVEVARTPLPAPLRVKEGSHRVAVIAERFAPSRKDVIVVPGRKTDVAFVDLIAVDKRLSHMNVRTPVPGVLLLLDGQPVAETPLSSAIALVPGRHRVELRRPGYVPLGRDVVLEEGATADLDLVPDEDAAAVRSGGARLALSLSEEEAVVTVNGKLRGQYVGTLLLPAGRHHVKVERGGFFPEERDVELSSRGATTLRIRFEPTPEYRAEYADRAGAFRRWGWIAVAGGAAFVGFGVGFTIWNSGAISSAEDDIAAFNASAKDGSGQECDALRPEYDEQFCSGRLNEVNAALDTAEGRAWLGIVGTAVGVAAAGLGVTLLLVGDDPGKYERRMPTERLAVRVRPDVALAPGVALAGLRGTF